MPPTISVAAFVFGIVFVLAALIGKEIEIVAIKIPALGKSSRFILGIMGAFLIYIGLFDPFHQISPATTASAVVQGVTATANELLTPSPTNLPPATLSPTTFPSPLITNSPSIPTSTPFDSPTTSPYPTATETSSPPTPTTTTIPTMTPTAIPLPSARGRIAFSSNRDETYGIYVMNADGSNPQIIPNYYAKRDYNPVWSPDGKQIAFISFREDPNSPALFSNIYVMNANGTNLHRLTESNWAEASPSWSPDGSKIVYYADPDSESGPEPADIFVFDLATQQIVSLTYGMGNNQDPTWSPDGSKIAFYSDRHGPEENYELYVMDYNGRNITRLTHQGGINYIPAWSPDGTKIAYTSGKGNDAEIYIINADGSNPRRLLQGPNNGIRDWFPTWSPDSKFIAYTSGSNSTQEIFIARVDSQDPPVNITNHLADDWYPTWTR